MVQAEDDGGRAVRARDLVGLPAGKALIVIGGKPAVEADPVGDHENDVFGAVLLRKGGQDKNTGEGSR